MFNPWPMDFNTISIQSGGTVPLAHCLMFQIPSAWLASKFGFKRVYGLSMLLAGILTLLFPVAARQAQLCQPAVLGPNRSR
jgi:hypothetical protein